jgi:DNA-binding IclR family transcriptional regulator
VVRAASGEAGGDQPFDEAFELDLAGIRSAGFSHVVDAAVAGVSGLAAPVFDGSGALVLSLTAIGATAALDTRAQGLPATALRRCAGELSEQLGAPAG